MVVGIRCFNILSAIICLVLRVLSLEFDHVQWCCFGSTAKHGHEPPGGSQWLAVTGSKEPMSGGKVGQWLAIIGSKPPSFQPCMTRDSHHFHSCNFPTMWWLCPFFMTISLLATLASDDHWSRFKNKSHEFIISQKTWAPEWHSKTLGSAQDSYVISHSNPFISSTILVLLTLTKLRHWTAVFN